MASASASQNIGVASQTTHALSIVLPCLAYTTKGNSQKKQAYLYKKTYSRICPRNEPSIPVVERTTRSRAQRYGKDASIVDASRDNLCSTCKMIKLSDDCSATHPRVENPLLSASTASSVTFTAPATHSAVTTSATKPITSSNHRRRSGSLQTKG